MRHVIADVVAVHATISARRSSFAPPFVHVAPADDAVVAVAFCDADDPRRDHRGQQRQPYCCCYCCAGNQADSNTKLKWMEPNWLLRCICYVSLLLVVILTIINNNIVALAAVVVILLCVVIPQQLDDCIGKETLLHLRLNYKWNEINIFNCCLRWYYSTVASIKRTFFI